LRHTVPRNGRAGIGRVLTIGLVVVILIVVALGATVLMGKGWIFPQHHTVSITNGRITPLSTNNKYDYYEFSVPTGARGASIQGSFAASGGSGNGIIVMVMDSTNFNNWVNRGIANTYYNGVKETAGTISASLPSGESFYLVYAYASTVPSSENVTTSVNLTYTN
jgi:hypothetical protein